MTVVSQAQLMEMYQQACEVELQAFKPGNVSVYADGHDMSVEDFRLSARVSAKPITMPQYSLGEKIYYAVKATCDAVGCNTNLGIILLCAPLIQAVQQYALQFPLRDSLGKVLTGTTVADADWAFRAIALAAPGGLGSSEKQDVAEKPQITLTEAMRIAEKKDRVALQYTTNYQDVFDFAILCYNGKVIRCGDKWAAVAVYAGLLSKYSDSHIERKYGNKYNDFVQSKMIEVDDLLSKTDKPEQMEELLYQTDAEFKKIGINPGTTADITVATLLTAYLNTLFVR
jgi:triphosphoribosyl-dephospho-CoA synthase